MESIWATTFFFRGIDLVIVFFGLFFLFRFCLNLFDNFFWALVIPVLIFTSPILVFYSNNFLANAPAFGIALVGWFFFTKFINYKKNEYLVLSATLFCFAGLLKMTALMLYVTIVVIFIIDVLGIIKFQKIGKIFFSPGKQLLILTLAPVIIFVWLLYVDHYNDLHSNHGFLLQGILPVWDMTGANIQRVSELLYFKLLPAYIHRCVFIITLGLFLINIFFYHKTNKLLLTISVLVFLGSVSYILLFFRVFDVHDYYLTNLLIFPIFVFLTFIDLLKRHLPNVYNSGITKVVLSL